MYTISTNCDDPNRVGCPDYDDNINEPVQTPPSAAELLQILDDDPVFWEAFSLDGIAKVYKFPKSPYQYGVNRQLELDFQVAVNDAIATQDFDALGKLIAAHMLDYAERIWRIRS